MSSSSEFLGKAISKTYTVTIPMKLPSCNTYIYECRKNRYAGAKMKAEVEDEIGWYLRRKLPEIKKPVVIHFHWVEGNKKRDLDGICFAKKFILDAMVKQGIIADDNRKYVTAFYDSFEYGWTTKVIIEVMEVEDGEKIDRGNDHSGDQIRGRGNS